MQLKEKFIYKFLYDFMDQCVKVRNEKKEKMPKKLFLFLKNKSGKFRLR